MKVERAEIVKDRFIVQYPLEAGLRTTTLEYIRDVERLNRSISDINPKIEELIKNEAWDEELQTIIEFVESVKNSSSFQDILRMPYRTETTNMWIVIHDPCYS